jgi:glycosyltransferase involved in cell wall biosynthesis
MKNKIIAVGPTTQNNTAVNGQSMMFQLLVDEVHHRNIKTIIVDIGVSAFSNKNRVSGKFSILKALDYIIILTKLFFILLFNQKQTVYVTTAQSKVGFIRDYYIILFARFFNSKIIAHQFGANYSGFYNSQTPFLQKKIKQTLSKVDKLVVEGDYTKAQFSFLPNYESIVYSLPNGLPEKIESSKIEAKTLDVTQPIKMFYLSNLIESKGFWDVLEAVNLLVNEEKINVEVVFAGKFLDAVDDQIFPNAEEAKKAFYSYIEEKNLQKKVLYFEGLYAKAKAEEFKKSHFFLLPSYYINEGQPVSVLEALAYGCVPIVTEYRLIPSMVNKQNGFFVNPKSPIEIVTIIKNLSKNPDLYATYSQSAIDYYLNNFTADKYTEKLIHLF